MSEPTHTHFRTIRAHTLRVGDTVLALHNFRRVMRISRGVDELDRDFLEVSFLDGSRYACYPMQEVHISAPPLFSDGTIPPSWIRRNLRHSELKSVTKTLYGTTEEEESDV